jgi:pilus assembly protein CpaB
MRDKPYLIALIAAVIAGIVAVIGATIWLRAFEASKITRIVTATQNIGSGEALTTQNLKLSEWTGSNVPNGALLEITPLLGRVTKANIVSGDVIRESSLVAQVSDGSLAAAISPGKRAFSIRVNEEEGVAGFVLPGNYVDILLSTKDSTGHPVSKFLLEKVLVAIAQETSKPNRSEPKVVNVVTLELTPQEAEKVDLAHLTGSLKLVLRNQLDKSAATDAKAASNDATQAAQVPAPKSGSRLSIEIIRGTARQTE